MSVTEDFDLPKPRTPTVHIFADESCLGNQFSNRKRPGAAAGMAEQRVDDHIWRWDYARFDPDTTNNRMALHSAIIPLMALRDLRGHRKIVFVSDSNYLVTGITQWVPAWQNRGWRRKGGPIENLHLWQRLCELNEFHDVKWQHVKGHSGHVENEYADYLATTAARTGKSLGAEENPFVKSRFEDWLIDRQDEGKFTDYAGD